MIVTASHPVVAAAEGPVGILESHGDVGSPKLAGAALYNAVSEEYTLRAGGEPLGCSRRVPLCLDASDG